MTRATPSATPTLREWLREAEFSLAMSSGFFGFFAHAGFMTVLEDEGLLPARVSGSSAGALVCGLWAAGVDATVMRDELLRLERDHFWDPALGPGLLRGRLFRAHLESLVREDDFASARVPLTLSVFDLFSRATRVIRSGAIARAIHASCAVPLLFQPVWLEGRPAVDGGLADRPGLSGLPGGRTLFHHLASRSPWRAAPPPIPRRLGLTAVVLPDLPRAGPFRLGVGRDAFEIARERTKKALDLRVNEGVVAA